MRHFLLSLLFLVTLAVSAADVRVVNGIRVDLQPIWDWQTAKAEGQEDVGERPMPHWRFFMILSVKQQMMGGWLCSARNEQGKPVEIVVLNLPKHVAELLQKISAGE